MRLPLSTTISNADLSEILDFIAQVLNLEPGNRYRARAYEEAAVVVQHLEFELADRFNQLNQQHQSDTLAKSAFKAELDALPSIGEAISAKLTELFSSGDIPAFQKYVAHLPGGMLPLVKIHGIGAKKALKLAQQFELNDPQTAIPTLLTKAKHGLVRGMTGFGEKSEQDLIEALESQHQKARIPLAKAQAAAQSFIKYLKPLPDLVQIEALGSIRREAATVGDIDLGVATNHSDNIRQAITSWSEVARTLVAGPNLVSVVLHTGWQLDIKFALPSEWGSFIQHFTGDKQHNIALREIALKKGLSLSEHGIKDLKTEKLYTFADEQEFYAYLEYNWIPPQERVGGKELVTYRLEKA